MEQADLIAGLTSAAEDVAQDWLARVQWSKYSGAKGVQLAIELASELARSEFLSKRSQAERLRSFLLELEIAEANLPTFAISACSFPPHLRQAATEFIPLELRPTLYGRRSARTEARPSIDPAPALRFTDAAQNQRGAANPIEAERLEHNATSRRVTVLLLAHPDRVDGNRRLLTGGGFDSIVVDIDVLRRLLIESPGICGCILDGSMLHKLAEEDQRDVIRLLASYSTFIHIRIHDDGLRLTNGEIERLIKQARGLGSDVPHSAFSVQADYALRSSELEAFDRASDLLRSHAGTEFVLGELSGPESELLVSAVRARIQAQRLDGSLQIDSATVRFLAGGLSGARLATVRVNSQGRTWVAKFTSKAQALDEIMRFRTFVHDWNPQLAPEAYFHHDVAVILSSLVRSDENSSIPAEPIEQRLTAVWNDQWLGCDTEPPVRVRASALGRGLQRVAQLLRELNSTSPVHSDLESGVNPRLDHVLNLEESGFDCGYGADGIRARGIAAERFKRLEHAGVVHGDVHLRNLLVRSNEEIHLIDYAASGRGHPAIDLVRLELALYLGPVRQFEDEARCVEFQHALSVQRTSLDELRSRFPVFFQCHVNDACAIGMIAARDEAIEALRAHDGGAIDYIAAKYLVAWQHLGLIGSNTGLARVVLLALAPELTDTLSTSSAESRAATGGLGFSGTSAVAPPARFVEAQPSS